MKLSGLTSHHSASKVYPASGVAPMHIPAVVEQVAAGIPVHCVHAMSRTICLF